MADDAVAEAPYCVVCRRSSAVKWRKHVFSRGHQQAAQQFLLHHVTRLQALCDAATPDVSAADRWRCVFCDAALATAAALTHFGSEPHRRRVEAFCRQHRCDADRQSRPQLWLNAARRRELEAALKKSEVDQAGQDGEREEERAPTVDQAANERAEAFLSSAAARLQEVQADRRRAALEPPVVEVETRAQQQEALLGPQMVLATGARRCKTVTSAEGVLQNPLGRHEGKRVWGGGIVKQRKAEWVPWAIDQLVKEEQLDHPDTLQTGADIASFAHRVTEHARGDGLSSIASVSWGASVGNVHTAAVPPWMVQTEEEYKQCNRIEQAAPPPALLKKGNSKAEAKHEKRRDVFTELQSKSEYGPDWLPNFGGVWQEGPRSKTKQAFRKSVHAAKSSCDRVPARPAEPRPSQLTAELPTQRKLSVKSQPPLPPQYPPSERSEVSSTPQYKTPTLPPPAPPKTEEGKSTTPNPLDAKKQVLLVQRERLRAKMAARRRQ
ncbi:hypothetical protein PHYPSEUDO_014925 [Phytophthora pseudosyringae]|uniref:Coiled-coil domain-containing protein 84 n=1 Tax=Phytophthora pseudosyringae TaxID=221518 RepID=A0A8T1W0R5_9STRA|nr:hypothetical protein PHYPSEUDO_014925 [Phytophthora pseudosyringae]